MLPIAVEIAPVEGHREDVSVLLAACSRAAADAECVLAADAPPGGAAAVAIVTWQSDGQAFVEVGMRRGGQPQWRSRNVNFSADDEPVERWRTVGFVIGTLARSELAGDTNPEPTPTTERSNARSPAPNEPPPRAAKAEPPQRAKLESVDDRPAQAAIDIGAEIGPGLPSGLRSGGVLRTRWPFQDPLRAVVSLKYLEQNDTTPDGRWFTIGAGLAGIYGNAHAEVSGAAEARVEYFEAKYDPLYGGAGMSRSRTSVWIAGLGLNATAVWMAMPMLGLYASGDAAWMFGTTRIHFVKRAGDTVLSDVVVTDKPVRLGVGAGIRLRLW